MNARELAILIASVALCGFIAWDSIRLNRRMRIRNRLRSTSDAAPSVVGTWLARHPR